MALLVPAAYGLAVSLTYQSLRIDTEIDKGARLRPPLPAPVPETSTISSDRQQTIEWLPYLCDLIAGNDIAALDAFRDNRSALVALGGDHVSALGSALERLDFRTAERLAREVVG